MELVQCSNVTYDYGSGALLRGVSLRIVAGERLGLIGPNGCGKTTLARLIAGELEPLHGSVSRRNDRTTVVVPQDYSGAPETTVRSLMLEELLEIEAEMRESEARMGSLSGPENEKLLARELARYERLTERYYRAGGPEAEC